MHSHITPRAVTCTLDSKWVCFGLLPIQLPDKYVRRNSRRNALLGGVLLNDPVNLLYKSRTAEVSNNNKVCVERFGILLSYNDILGKHMASVRSTCICSRAHKNEVTLSYSSRPFLCALDML